MIIGFEAKRLYQNLSGLGNYSRNTIRLLTKYFPDHQYVLFAPKLSPFYTAEQPVSVVLPGKKLHKRLRFYWRMYGSTQSIKRSQVELFHGLSHVLPFGLRRLGIPSVVTIHDLIFLRFPQFYKKIDRWFYRLQTVSGCRRATKIIAISQQTKNDLVHFFSIDPAKIEVIYQTCDQRFYDQVDEADKLEIRKKFNLPDRYILTVGTIESRKNQLNLLKGVVSENLTIPVVVLGKATPYKKELDDFILESNIRHQLIFLHNADFYDLQAIYQMAEVMVYPSFFEGFGLPVLEAQASGCPVITSNISSMPEAGGAGALYIDPENSAEIGSAIKLMLTNEAERQKWIEKGKENARLFSDQIVAEKLMNLYQSLTGTNKGVL